MKQEEDAKMPGEEEEVKQTAEPSVGKRSRERGYSGRKAETTSRSGKKADNDPDDLTQSGAAKTRSREEAGWIGMEGGQGSKARRKDDPERQNRDRDRDREAGKPSSGEAERQRAMSWEMHRLDLLSLDPLLFPRARGW